MLFLHAVAAAERVVDANHSGELPTRWSRSMRFGEAQRGRPGGAGLATPVCGEPRSNGTIHSRPLSACRSQGGSRPLKLCPAGSHLRSVDLQRLLKRGGEVMRESLRGNGRVGERGGTGKPAYGRNAKEPRARRRADQRAWTRMSTPPLLLSQQCRPVLDDCYRHRGFTLQRHAQQEAFAVAGDGELVKVRTLDDAGGEERLRRMAGIVHGVDHRRHHRPVETGEEQLAAIVPPARSPSPCPTRGADGCPPMPGTVVCRPRYGPRRRVVGNPSTIR